MKTHQKDYYKNCTQSSQRRRNVKVFSCCQTQRDTQLKSSESLPVEVIVRHKVMESVIMQKGVAEIPPLKWTPTILQ